jgi:hypothetical protein
MILVTTSEHRAFRLAIVAGIAILVVIGLLIAGSVISTTSDATTGTRITAPAFSTLASVESLGPKTFDIVSSPVIEPNPVFYFGTGDGSAGYYAEQPRDEPQQIGSAALTNPRSDTPRQDRERYA